MNNYRNVNQGYATDGEESAHAASTISEYLVSNEHRTSRSRNNYLEDGPRSLVNASSKVPPRTPSALSYCEDIDGSDIYVTSAAYKNPLELSHPRSVYSMADSAKTSKSSMKRGAKVELMSAPNPFCPNIKGVCCLMFLLNLGLILITLGFVIVIQFYEPLFVWILGIIFLVFGFITLVGCMIYCVVVCRDTKTPAQLREEDLYWTKHWQKHIGYVPNEMVHPKYEDFDRYSIANKSLN